MTRFTTMLLVAGAMLACAAVPAAAAAKHADAPSGPIEAHVPDKGIQQDFVVFAYWSSADPRGWKTARADASTTPADLKPLAIGDQVQFWTTPADAPTVRWFRIENRYADWPARWTSIGVAFFLLVALAAIASRGDLRSFFVGVDKRYSKSQTQLALWSTVLFVGYLAAVFLRVWNGGLHLLGGVAITQNLLLLSGLSALSFGAAKAITINKTGTPGLPGKSVAARPNLRDLVCDDMGNVDLGDFQMMLITAIAVVVYFWQIFDFLGVVSFAGTVKLPDIDTVLLSSFGVGQGAYLAKKAAGPVGKA